MAQVRKEATAKQWNFLHSEAFETLYGGAAGGGKSYGQVLDACQFAMKYKKSRQIIFRRTFVELELSIEPVAREIFPQGTYKYNATKHEFTFLNGSKVYLGYIGTESDVYKYQSAEFDVIRFDELTHFTEKMYKYMLSRVRGANNYPKGVKSTTNPGGVGHTWVKERFIDIGDWGEIHEVYQDGKQIGTRTFIPSLVTENKFLMQKDPRYLERLENLDETERLRLRYGDWDAYDGRFFEGFNRDVHVIKPLAIPEHWRTYEAFDYGLDMLACYQIAIDDNGKSYVVNEIYKSNLIVSEAAETILHARGKKQVRATFAPPDIFGDKAATGTPASEHFRKNGVRLWKVQADRINGWRDLKEKMRIIDGETQLVIFDTCTNLIRSLSNIQADEHNPDDCAKNPHELTHACDALRYYVAGNARPQKQLKEEPRPAFEIKRKSNSEKGEKMKII
ncbi:MAG: phage terminase large subunit [Bacillota bacterium]